MRKKLLLLAMVLLGLTGKAMADDMTFSVGEIQQGKYGVVTVYSTIASNHYNGFEIHWTAASMPEGFTITQIVPSDELLVTYPDIVLDFNLRDDYFVLMGWTSKSATEYLPIGDKVPICDIYFEAEESLYDIGYSVILDVDHAEFSLEGVSTHLAGTSYGLENKEIVLSIVEPQPRVIDENSTKDIADSYKGNAEDLLVKRTIKANTWSTLYLPFSMSYSEKRTAFGDNVYTLNAEDNIFVNEEGNKFINLNFTKLGTYTGISANTLYLVKTSKDVNEFELKGKIVAKTTTAANPKVVIDVMAEQPYTITEVGSYKVQKIPENGVFLNNNKFYYSAGNSNIKALRGYFVLDDYFNNGANGANINILIDGEETAVEGLTNSLRANDDVYSISGVYMGKASDMKKLPRGMYIVNNKKLTVK